MKVFSIKFDRRTVCGIILFCLYLALNAFLAFCHEPWRDEAQTWLLARDVPFFSLPGMMSYEGHPVLWHMLIWPLVHIGLPYWSQQLLALLLVLAAVFFIVFKAPFPFIFKAILILSPFFSYYPSVIARSYALIPIIMILLAILFPKRKEQPFLYCFVIALLVHTHVLMIMTAFSLSLSFLIETLTEKIKYKKFIRNSIPALFLPFISAVLLVLGFISGETSSYLNIKTASLRRTIVKFCEKCTDNMDEVYGISTESVFGLLIICAGIIIFTAAIIYTKNKALWLTVSLVLTCTSLFQLWFDTMVYNSSLQKLFTFTYVLVWALWLCVANGSGRIFPYAFMAYFSVMCILCLYNLLPEIQKDSDGQFSNGAEAAEWIRENIEPEAIIYTDNMAEVSSILPYLDRRTFIYVPDVRPFTYVVWDSNWLRRCTFNDFMEYLTLAGIKKPVYLLSCTEDSFIEGLEEYTSTHEPLFTTSVPSFKGEDFAVYQIN